MKYKTVNNDDGCIRRGVIGCTGIFVIDDCAVVIYRRSWHSRLVELAESVWQERLDVQ